MWEQITYFPQTKPGLFCWLKKQKSQLKEEIIKMMYAFFKPLTFI